MRPRQFEHGIWNEQSIDKKGDMQSEMELKESDYS